MNYQLEATTDNELFFLKRKDEHVSNGREEDILQTKNTIRLSEDLISFKIECTPNYL